MGIRDIKPTTRRMVYERDRYQCQYCGAMPPKVKIQIDHIIPVAKDGGNETSKRRKRRMKKEKNMSEKTTTWAFPKNSLCRPAKKYPAPSIKEVKKGECYMHKMEPGSPIDIIEQLDDRFAKATLRGITRPMTLALSQLARV